MRHPFHLAGLVAGDHASMETLIARIEADQGDRTALFAQVSLLLALHGTAEEQVLYPQMRALGLGDAVAHHAAEHRRIADALVELDRHPAGSDVAEQAMQRIVETLRRHVLVEEQQVMSRLSSELGDERMLQLGRAYLEAERRAPTHAHPHAHLPGAAPGSSSALFTGPAAMIDRLRDAITGRHEASATDASWLLDAQAQLVVDAYASLVSRPGRTMHLLDPEVARQQPTLIDAAATLLDVEGRPARPSSAGDERVEDVVIPGPGGPLTLRLYRPPHGTGTEAPLPVYLHVHGGAGLGGGVVGGLDHADGACRAIVRQAACLVVGVGHRLAPEHPFPAGHDDVLAALRWLMSDAAVVGADTRRVAIGGEGIGATMAAAAAIHVRSTGRGPVAIVLVTPMTHPAAAIEPSTAASFPSWQEAADARPMSSAVARWCLGHLVDDPADLDDPRLSLLTLPATALARFPRTLVITAERDPWRDEGAAFAAALLGAGVEVEHTRYDGVMHGFFSVPEVIDRAAIAQTQVAAALCRAFDPGHLRGLMRSTPRTDTDRSAGPPAIRPVMRPGGGGHAGALGRTGGLRP